MNVLSVVGADKGKIVREIGEFPIDSDGSETIKLLSSFVRLLSRITGNEAGSLGLHPAVYFYTDKGRHLPDLFMGMILLIREKIENNDREYFKKFCAKRGEMEQFLIDKKSLITQALQLARSKERFVRAKEMFGSIVSAFENGSAISDEELVRVIAPNARSAVLSLGISAPGKNFSEDTKSQIYIRDALRAALRCSLCNGLVEPLKAVSFDHIERKSEGGHGGIENGQMTHPYCNTAVKN